VEVAKYGKFNFGTGLLKVQVSIKQKTLW